MNIPTLIVTRPSIGVKLVAAFAGIILLCLGLAGAAFVYLLQPYQTQQALNRLAGLALPLAVQVRILELQGATPAEIGEFLEGQAKELRVRVLLVRLDDLEVAYDSGGGLSGYTLAFEGGRRPGLSPVLQGTVDIPGEGTLAFVSVGVPPRGTVTDRLRRRFFSEDRQFTVALAAPRSSLAAEWLQIVPQLGAAALISLVVSVGVAFVIARSISRPLAAITRASEAMARGDYGQRIPVSGRDEVARLATTFNVMAEQVSSSNRTLRAFLADVSHELRTPLTTVQGFSQAILDGTARDPQSVAESARIIKEDATRMERMVEDLLDLSKIESGQVQMDVETLQLTEIIEGAVKRARQRGAGSALCLQVADEPHYARADPHRIEQVLDNLLTNALHHTPSGGRITVSVARRGDETRVCVHNTGSFVAKEDRDRIFQRFWRGSGDEAGSGLGLAIAAEIARQHGGRIDVESSPTDGTAFTLVLPRARSDAASGLSRMV